ncbi:hypothetical protein VNO77_34943 [Canavalia gladiata]|uniref:Uncharacterized protein n=1 Tax=Canavalia gladiata TaxID=3824 RepID=A0AAN9PXH9_CANGL
MARGLFNVSRLGRAFLGKDHIVTLRLLISTICRAEPDVKFGLEQILYGKDRDPCYPISLIVTCYAKTRPGSFFTGFGRLDIWLSGRISERTNRPETGSKNRPSSSNSHYCFQLLYEVIERRSNFVSEIEKGRAR